MGICRKHPHGKCSVDHHDPQYAGSYTNANPKRQKDANGTFTFNSDNKALKEAAIDLYGARRIKKSAHSRYVAKDFTPEEQAAIRAKAQSNTVGKSIVCGPKAIKEYDNDSLSKTPRVSRTIAGPKQPSEKQRKKSEFLEAELQKAAFAYAASIGVRAEVWDNDSNPDAQFWYEGKYLGAAEFKSPKGIPRLDQKLRIKDLREYHKDDKMFMVYRVLENFKTWLDGRKARVI